MTLPTHYSFFTINVYSVSIKIHFLFDGIKNLCTTPRRIWNNFKTVGKQKVETNDEAGRN